MLWRVPLNLGGRSCISLLSISLILVFPPTGPLNKSEEFHFFGTWIPRILGQPLVWAFGYWMVSWRMYGCGNPFKHFFAKYSHHLSILTQVSVPLLFQVFDHSNPLTFVSMHSQPYFMSPNSLVSSEYPWKVNSSHLPHKFKLTPSQFPKGSPASCIRSPPSICLNWLGLHPPLPLWPYPFPHLLSPYFMSAFSGILHLQHTPPLYMYIP